MKAVFADTSFFIAFLCHNYKHHKQALNLMATLEEPIVTTKWILAELGSFLSKGTDRALFANLIEKLLRHPHVRILSADDSSFKAGIALFNKRHDKDWSLIDCISFAIMQQLELTHALTADRHFQQAGNMLLIP